MFPGGLSMQVSISVSLSVYLVVGHVPPGVCILPCLTHIANIINPTYRNSIHSMLFLCHSLPFPCPVFVHKAFITAAFFGFVWVGPLNIDKPTLQQPICFLLLLLLSTVSFQPVSFPIHELLFIPICPDHSFIFGQGLPYNILFELLCVSMHVSVGQIFEYSNICILIFDIRI